MNTPVENALPPEAAARDAYAPLRIPDFRALMIGILFFTMGLLAQDVIIGYEVYRLTHDPLSLGLLGLAEALPFIGLALFGGHIADRRDRRQLVLVSTAVFVAGTAILLVLLSPLADARLSAALRVDGTYGVMMLLGLARGIFSPAATALRALLVPRILYTTASAWNSSAWQTGAVAGPLLAGVFYAAFGIQGSLLAILILEAGALLLFTRIGQVPSPDPKTRPDNLWRSLREGIDFVRGNRILLYAISLDLFSVLFGGVVAILPVFAQDILHTGPTGLGIMRAAPAVGALLTVIACAHFSPAYRPWRNLLIAVTGFGVATLVFAVSRQLWLSTLALFATGAFDSVSVVVRGTLLQVLPPDHLRGRVSSVNGIFIASSNELGAFESGLTARLMGAVPSVLFGAAVTLATAAYVWGRSKPLFKVRVI